MIDFNDINERNRIKSVVAARDPEGIQIAIDNKDFALKSYAAKAVDLDAHEIGFIVNRDSVDRDGERILPSAYKKDFPYYLANPVVLYNHNMSEPAVGQMVKHTITDKEILMRVKFAYDENPRAAMLWKLYSADPPYMRMVSNGFIPLAASDKEKDKLPGQKNLTFTRIEMIELSLVNIGANRHAYSMIPKGITDDPILNNELERMLEETPEIPGVVQAFEPTELKSENAVHVKIPDAHNPIIVSVALTDETETESESETKEVETPMAKDNEEHTTKAPCPACAEKEATHKRIVVLQKDMNLADTLNTIIGDGDDRSDAITSMASEAGIEIKAVKTILDGDTETLSTEHIKGFATALAVSEDTLTAAAAVDGWQADDVEKSNGNPHSTKEMSEADARQKYYGSMSYMSSKGSHEDTRKKIMKALKLFLPGNLPNAENLEYIDIDLLATYDDHAIFGVWNTKTVYRVDYTMPNGNITLGTLTQVEASFQPVSN